MEIDLLDLTVIIPNYNTCGLLQQCLESIYENTSGITFEVICIDDNSSDGSAEMVESLFPGVILVRNRSASFTQGITIGAFETLGRDMHVC